MSIDTSGAQKPKDEMPELDFQNCHSMRIKPYDWGDRVEDFERKEIRNYAEQEWINWIYGR